MKNSLWKRVLSLLLASIIATLSIAGCGDNATSIGDTGASNPTALASNSLSNSGKGIPNQPTVDELVEISRELQLTTDWEDYVGDIETSVYGLLANELMYCYDVFPAYVTLENGVSVSGMAYTDYSEGYTDDEKSEVYFEAVLLSYSFDLDIPESEFENGLELYDYDYSNEKYRFILAYKSDEIREHCVVYGKYVQYGINSDGQIFYEEQDYQQENCDESLGSLYSYDEQKYLYSDDVGEYVYVDGESLSTLIDYDELEHEINAILEEQDLNFVSVDIQTTATIAQEAVLSYLLSMQEESFLGYDVDSLVEAARKLDPVECYRLTDNGLMTFLPEEESAHKASDLTKWLVGTACVIVTIVSVVEMGISMEFPPISAAAGARAGMAVDLFMQVVISGKALDSVDWRRVIISAASGALSGYAGPYISANFEGVGLFLVDSALDGLIGGMDGEDGERVLEEFGLGLGLGFAISASFKAVTFVTGKIVTGISKPIAKAIKKRAPQLVKTLKMRVSKAKKFFEKKIKKYRKTLTDKGYHSDYITKRLMEREYEKLQSEATNELTWKSFKQLEKNLKTKEILDKNNNKITIEELKKLFDEAADGEVIGKIIINNETVSVVKKNSVVGIYFDPTKYQTVSLPDGLVANRNKNFINAAEEFRKNWIKDPSSMPDEIKKILQTNELDLEDISARTLVDIIQSSSMVMHENTDLMTITLVSRELHDTDLGGVFHLGGYRLAKYVKQQIGIVYFNRFVSAAASAVS